MANVAAEDKALITLTQIGAIRSSSKSNYFRDQNQEAIEKFGRGMWGDRWDKTDPAHREYDYIRWIDGLDFNRFVEFCSENDINYKEESALATLEIVNEAPAVHVGDATYILKTLQSGTTLDIIRTAYDHADVRFGFDELRRWTGKGFTEQKRFTDIFRKNEFSKNKELHPFVDITAQTFMLKKQTHLTPSQLALIQKASIK